MNASLQEAILLYCESCKKEKRRLSCFGCIFDQRRDDLGDAVIAVGVEMDARRTHLERMVDAVRRVELLSVLLWRRMGSA